MELYPREYGNNVFGRLCRSNNSRVNSLTIWKGDIMKCLFSFLLPISSLFLSKSAIFLSVAKFSETSSILRIILSLPHYSKTPLSITESCCFILVCFGQGICFFYFFGSPLEFFTSAKHFPVYKPGV